MLVYIDCSFGISGDMFLGALIDLGVPLKEIEQPVKSLKLSNFKLSTRKDKRGAIAGRMFKVDVTGRQVSRDYKTIREMITGAKGLSPTVKKMASAIFKELAVAEGRIHGVPPAKVHFHEVGAVDSIVDIVGACVALEWLGIEESACSPVPLGSGQIQIGRASCRERV